MKLLILITIFFASLSIHAQTVNVSQEFLDNATKCFSEVVALRDEVVKLKALAGADTVVKSALQAQIDALNGLIAIKDRKEQVYESMLALDKLAFATYDNIVKVLTDMNAKLVALSNKPRSGFQKFMSVMRDVLLIAAGITFGRGHL